MFQVSKISDVSKMSQKCYKIRILLASVKLKMISSLSCIYKSSQAKFDFPLINGKCVHNRKVATLLVIVKFRKISTINSFFPFQHYFLDASVMMCITHVLLRYFHLTTFFWMFVEGKLDRFYIILLKLE